MQAIQCLILLKKESMDREWLENIFTEKLEEFHCHTKFAIRIHTLFTINELYKEVSDQFINDKLYKKYMK